MEKLGDICKRREDASNLKPSSAGVGVFLFDAYAFSTFTGEVTVVSRQPVLHSKPLIEWSVTYRWNIKNAIFTNVQPNAADKDNFLFATIRKVTGLQI